MTKNENGKRLNESQRCEIIEKLSKLSTPSKRAIAREYGVSASSIQNIWVNREKIVERSALMTDQHKKQTFHASVGKYKELEDMLYVWIDSMQCANLPVPPSLAIAKARGIASKLDIW